MQTLVAQSASTEKSMNFEDLGLIEPLQRAIAEAGYDRPTPIQAATIPVARTGQDVIGCAQTGTGKTAAFCLPALERAYAASGNDAALHTLIVTPTRELAAQINDSLATYGKHLDLWHTVIFGGVSEKPQIAEIKRGVDLLVATPGRLIDLMARGIVKLDSVQCFILDEADRMLDMGFINDVRRIVRALPDKRQTLFFSATMPTAIRKLASSLVTNAKNVSVDPPSSTVETIEQSVYFTDKGNKRDLLVHLLKKHDCTRTVVFSRTKHGADRVVRHLDKAGIKSAAIHGNKAQNARIRALQGFRDGVIPVLVATDLAARGIDVDDISHVINFDLPNISETYVHRIGRTGRAGKSGVALSLCEAEERTYLMGIERLTGKKITRVEDHPYPATETVPPKADRQAARSNSGNSGNGGDGRGRRNGSGGKRAGSVRGANTGSGNRAGRRGGQSSPRKARSQSAAGGA